MRAVQLYRRIRALKTDELEFDLQFEFTPSDEEGGTAARHTFRPRFDQPMPAVTNSVAGPVGGD
jgi:hypothetical protein